MKKMPSHTGSVATPETLSVGAVRRVEVNVHVGPSLRKKPGRKPSPRTYQIHPKLLPEVGEAIAEEAAKRGITQGHLIEMLWCGEFRR